MKKMILQEIRRVLRVFKWTLNPVLIVWLVLGYSTQYTQLDYVFAFLIGAFCHDVITWPMRLFVRGWYDSVEYIREDIES